MEGETLFSFLDFGDEGNVVAEFFSTSGAVRRWFGADFGQVRRVRLKCRRGVFFEGRRRPSQVRRGFWASSARPFASSARSRSKENRTDDERNGGARARRISNEAE